MHRGSLSIDRGINAIYRIIRFILLYCKFLPTGSREEPELLGDYHPETIIGNKIQYVCSLKDELEIHGSVTLEIEYTTIVPIEDTSFTLKIDKLCKQFDFSLSYDSKEIDTTINLFYFDTLKKDT